MRQAGAFTPANAKRGGMYSAKLQTYIVNRQAQLPFFLAFLIRERSKSASGALQKAPRSCFPYNIIYIRARGDKRQRPRPALDSPWHKRARFGEAEQKSYLCISRKRKSAGFSSFRVLRGQLSYMSGKIVLYDRKNYKQARENLLGDNFYEVLYREKFL